MCVQGERGGQEKAGGVVVVREGGFMGRKMVYGAGLPELKFEHVPDPLPLLACRPAGCCTWPAMSA